MMVMLQPSNKAAFALLVEMKRSLWRCSSRRSDVLLSAERERDVGRRKPRLLL